MGSADRREGVLSESNGLSGASEAAASGRMGRHGTQVAVVVAIIGVIVPICGSVLWGTIWAPPGWVDPGVTASSTDACRDSKSRSGGGLRRPRGNRNNNEVPIPAHMVVYVR